MNHPIVESSEGVTLLAGGPLRRRDLALALARAPRLVAADGGADRALAVGRRPEAVIGDMDSLTPQGRAALAGRLHEVPEQESTDFDKALRSIAAPFVLALGVAGGRIDHELAVLNVLARRPDRVCLLIGPEDVVFHAPATVTLALRPGDRLSLFPLAPVTGESDGLRWPIKGLRFAPGGVIGTSNEVTDGQVRLRFDAPGMLVLLPKARLDAALEALVPGWRKAAKH
ncbi:thiamine diphosphokinase [Rhodobacter ferrooxidans]|uniref:Thiamine diphosphokinase n=1 Tax=Rhodobacter ferrooxidans TaxID=371731 RepID=C8S064_9RHOB|nr:thiamine diphosphokinase [Rhodobacter sp. SW2]EEW25673.1 thiamine pyrophosphokinase [Rhodobacter sp. SW2]